MSQACLDVTVPYATQREQFGQRIGDFQLVQGKLADMYAATKATRAFIYATAREADAGRADRKDCAAVILFAAEHATRMALDAIQILGAGTCLSMCIKLVGLQSAGACGYGLHPLMHARLLT